MILSIFSPLWFLLFAVDAVLVVIITLLLKDKTIDDKAKAMTALAVCCINSSFRRIRLSFSDR